MASTGQWCGFRWLRGDATRTDHCRLPPSSCRYCARSEDGITLATRRAKAHGPVFAACGRPLSGRFNRSPGCHAYLLAAIGPLEVGWQPDERL